MPKMKTNKAAKKRYSLTATGKVKRTTANRQKLSARRPGAYADKSCENTIKKLLPYGN